MEQHKPYLDFSFVIFSAITEQQAEYNATNNFDTIVCIILLPSYSIMSPFSLLKLMTLHLGVSFWVKGKKSLYQEKQKCLSVRAMFIPDNNGCYAELLMG